MPPALGEGEEDDDDDAEGGDRGERKDHPCGRVALPNGDGAVGQSPVRVMSVPPTRSSANEDDQVEPDHQHEQPVETRLEPPGREGEEEVAERPEGGC